MAEGITEEKIPITDPHLPQMETEKIDTITEIVKPPTEH
jgi:hypothetical protein